MYVYVYRYTDEVAANVLRIIDEQVLVSVLHSVPYLSVCDQIVSTSNVCVYFPSDYSASNPACPGGL